MADTDELKRFEVYRREGSKEEEPVYSNWVLLNRSWCSFLVWMGNRWWGPASEEYITLFLSTLDVRVGRSRIILTESLSNVEGGVCSGFIKKTSKSNSPLIKFHIFFEIGHWQWLFFGIRYKVNPSKDLIGLLRGILRDFRGVLAARPALMQPTDPNSVPVTRVVNEMREMIVTLESVWWGLEENSDQVHEQLKIMSENQKLRVHEDDRIAFALAYTDREANYPGYLFNLITSEIRATVTFNGRSKFLYNSQQFTTLRAILDHVRTVEKDEFVARVFPTLQELTSYVTLKHGLEQHETIPRHLKEYIKSTQY